MHQHLDWSGYEYDSSGYEGANTLGDILTLRKGILKVADEGPGIVREMGRRQNERFVHLSGDVIP